MSHLLEALRKSDRERRQAAEPALASIHLQHRFGGHRKHRWQAVIVSVAVVAVTTVAIWWVRDQGWTLSTVFGTAKLPTPPVQASSPVREVPALEENSVPSAIPSAQTLPALWDLPAAVRIGIPALQFSLHVYSDDPAKRSIVVNDRIVHEGDRIGDNLTLAKITTDGVVMRYKGTWFRVNVLENW